MVMSEVKLPGLVVNLLTPPPVSVVDYFLCVPAQDVVSLQCVPMQTEAKSPSFRATFQLLYKLFSFFGLCHKCESSRGLFSPTVQ